MVSELDAIELNEALKKLNALDCFVCGGWGWLNWSDVPDSSWGEVSTVVVYPNPVYRAPICTNCRKWRKNRLSLVDRIRGRK